MFSDMHEEWDRLLAEKTEKKVVKQVIDEIIWYSVKRIGQSSGDSYYQISFDRLAEIAKRHGVEIKLC